MRGILLMLSSVITFLKQWFARKRQRQKMLVYNVFESDESLTDEQILRRLRNAGRKHDLENEPLFARPSLWSKFRYRIKKSVYGTVAFFTTQRYSINNLSKLELLLYELIQDGVLKKDGEKYFRTR